MRMVWCALAIAALPLLAACRGKADEENRPSFTQPVTTAPTAPLRLATGTYTARWVGSLSDSAVWDAGIAQPAQAQLTLSADGARVQGSVTGAPFDTGVPTAGASLTNDPSSGLRVFGYAGGPGAGVVLSDGTAARSLQHMAFGIWSTPPTGTTPNHFGGAFGPPSGPVLFTSGTSTFEGNALIWGESPTASGYSQAPVQLAVDWGAGRVSGVIEPSTRLQQNTAPTLPRMTVSPQTGSAVDAAAGTFSGQLTSAPTAGLTGTIAGRFFGPNAEEAGGALVARSADHSTRFVGAFGARR